MQGNGPSTQETSLSQAAAVLPRVPPLSTAQANESVSTKIDVQSLFNQAMNSADSQAKIMPGNVTENSGKPKKPASRVVSNDEFAALFKSLEELHISEEKNRQNVENEEVCLGFFLSSVSVKHVLEHISISV